MDDRDRQQDQAPPVTGVPAATSEVTGWTIALDTLARASAVAAAAVAETDLHAGVAQAVSGQFADWAIVDLLGGGQGQRVVTAADPDPVLDCLLRDVPLRASPVIWSAVRRSTPAVHAWLDDEFGLGRLPDGRPLATVLGACSVAVGPIVSEEGISGAVTAVRRTGRHYLGFLELGILAQIGELAGAAATRLRRR